MVGDQLDCPFCGHPYSEEYLESIVNKSFKCEACNKKIIVRLRKGFIRAEKRTERMIYYKKILQEKENHKYMISIVTESIKQIKHTYNEKLYKEFFEVGKLLWVREARKIFYIWCDSVDIPRQNIISFFKKNNGRTDIRTIKQYLNG